MNINFKLSTYIIIFLTLLSSSSSSHWLSFLNLTGSHLGDHHPSLPLLKTYLHRFGYLSQNLTNDDIFGSDLETAIKTYQQNFHLNPTGHLDLPTISQLISPRCGVADIINASSSSSSSGRQLYTYFPYNPTWPPSKHRLTYAFTSTSSVSISLLILRPLFARAFARWSAVTLMNFTEVGPFSDPDITIGFFSRDHGDGEAFDGPLGTLAHAFAPMDGRFHLDADETWVAEGDVTEAGEENAVDMESVVVHEIGHLLGLGHSWVEEAIMYPTIGTRMRKVELRRDDVEGVQSLYGRNPRYRGGDEVGPSPARENEKMSSGCGVRWWGRVVGGWVLGGILYLHLV